ncbi:MAG: Na+/H+ antiporter NhaA [Pseudohongiellaceae bacterium]
MSNPDNSDTPPEPIGEGINLAPWEKPFERIITPFEEFITRQTTTGLLLMGTTVAALVLANSNLAGVYEELINLYAGISIGSWELRLTLHHWVNDGLMALFFFVVGLELKREILVGELARPRQAVLPIVGALGGMLLPALIYLAFNYDGEGARGWGIPMATDIAFAIGVLVLLAKRVPKTLITFLVALAIVDDLGAVLVIALFYTESIVTNWLLAVILVLALLALLNLIGVRIILPYFLLAVGLWYALLQSGIHATVAGVLGAFSVPARPRYDPGLFSRHVRDLLLRFDTSYKGNRNIMLNNNLHAIVQTFEDGIHSVQPPLLRLEHIWHVPVAFLVIPVFALFNAGIPINVTTMDQALASPVALGIAAGLLLGKFVGITGCVWIALKLGIGQLPAGTRFSQIAGVSFLAGIGFTMAIFIAELGFTNQPDELLMAKMGILIASLIAGIVGYIWLYLCSGKPDLPSS